MAKITVNVDTEAKTLEVLVNGEAQANVEEANFYVYEYDRGQKELAARISLVDRNKETGITKVTYLMAKESKEGREALAIGAKASEKYTDLLETGGSEKVKQDIANYFSRQ